MIACGLLVLCGVAATWSVIYYFRHETSEGRSD